MRRSCLRVRHYIRLFKPHMKSAKPWVGHRAMLVAQWQYRKTFVRPLAIISLVTAGALPKLSHVRPCQWSAPCPIGQIGAHPSLARLRGPGNWSLTKALQGIRNYAGLEGH